MMKVQLKINRAKMFLPSAVRKGTARDRFLSAVEMNDRFYKSLKYEFEDRKVKPNALKTALQDASQSNIKVEIYRPFDDKIPVCPRFNSKGVSNGYVIQMPFMNNQKLIHQSSIIKILKTSQNFFDEILNPKFLRRKMAMREKGYNLEPATNFFADNIQKTKAPLDMKALDEFLKPMSDDEKINSLQLLRYSLIKEHNADRYVKHFMLEANQNPMSDTKYTSEAILSNTYFYPEKLEAISQKLKETIQAVREKF